MPTRSPWRALLILASSCVSAWVAVDWWERQPQPVPNADGVPLLAWYVLGALTLAALLRSRSVPRPPLVTATLLVTGLVPLLVLLTMALPVEQPVWLACLAAAATLYAAVYLARGLCAITGRRQPAAVVWGVAFLIGFVISSNVTDAIPDVWNPRETPATVSDRDIAAREAALFEQADRIDRALDAVHRDASPQPRAFFLGFAGVGEEKVFAQEIGLASRVIGERYGVDDRRISLVNDERDLDSAPLASVSGLDYALHGMASRMELDRDVLFLAISSHGSEDPAIAVENSNFPLTDLSPQDLADALRDAGIRWRVIIISACYAGGFIGPLRDSSTILITAAAADRTSFGCSSDAELTYFGEAFYRDALPGAQSLQDAFEEAKRAIAKRESAAGETPSNPQAYFGAQIEAKLAGMDLTEHAR